MKTLDVRHVTTYRYSEPVSFGDHRMMLRPRDSHDLRVLTTSLTITPPATLRWVHDVFGNSITIASFETPASELVVESTFRIEHYPAEETEIVVDPGARTYPFTYDDDDLFDLRSSLAVEAAAEDDPVSAWARRFLGGSFDRNTLEMLVAMNDAIKADFTYASRDDVGTQTAAETLSKGTGSCRDFAMLFIEASRSLGIAGRFVSGYLYDDALAGGHDAVVGSGATHAWAEVFLPGAGWVEFDPTNGLVGGRNLIRVAVARTPSQAVPLGGSFTGKADAFVGMEVAVTVVTP